jgi:hypothetical protein
MKQAYVIGTKGRDQIKLIGVVIHGKDSKQNRGEAKKNSGGEN